MSAATASHRAARWRWLLGVLALIFGVLSVLSGGRVLFGDEASRLAAGHVVPFVLVFNFGGGFVYALAGVAILSGRSWSLWLARALAASTLVVFALLGVHVLRGGAHELRTLLAMSVRSAFWLGQALLLPRWLGSAR